MSTASSMHLVLVDSPPMTPNDSAQNENGANILENVKQTDNNKSDCIQSDSKNNTPKCIPKVTPIGTPKGTPKDTPKGTPRGSPRGTPKSTPRHEVEIGNKTTENSTDNVIYDWGSKQTADISSESDQSYDVPIPKVPSSSNSDNDQNITSNESSQSEFPPALTIDSDHDHDEIFTNQADHLGKFYIKLCIKNNR